MNFKLLFIALTLFLTKKALAHTRIFSNKSKIVSFILEKNDSLTNNISYQTAKTKYNKKKYPDALKEAFQLLNRSKKNQDFIIQFKSLELIGDIYLKTSNNKLSLKYFNSALNILNYNLSKKTDNNQPYSYTNSLAKIYLKMGSAYLKIYNNAKHNLNRNKTQDKLAEVGITKINKYPSEKNIEIYKDSALYFLTKLEKLASINDEILKYKASSHINLSAMYQIDSMFSKAKDFALKAIKIHTKRNDKIKLAKSQSNLASVYLSTGEFLKAKKTYLKAIESIKRDESQKATKLKANLYYNLAWAMRNLKDYKAYDFQELSYEIEDVIRDNNLAQIIKKIEANNKETLEQQKINLVEEQRKLEETQQAKTTLLFGALSLLVIVISGVVIYNYKLRQSNLQLKLSESDLLQQQSIEKLKSDAQIKILNATIDGKETERKQIAETLHDNVSALLSSANMHLSATKKQFNGDTPQEIEKTRQIILEASQKVRDLSHNLISSILLKFGLEYALKDVVKKYSNSELAFEVKANNISRYNQEFEIKIFNVIQELINNIIKHSNASNAEIILKAENNQLTILVKDDGVGFTTSSSSINDGIGLNQIEARIKMMNGKLAIDSEPDKGTEVFILVPIQQQKEYGSLSSVS